MHTSIKENEKPSITYLLFMINPIISKNERVTIITIINTDIFLLRFSLENPLPS